MATLSMSGVNKRYPNGAHAVRGVAMDIADGEFMVFVGPSGCGKSTLLRMVAGLETITEGDISINEERINDRSPAERNVAMVFQNYALYPHMTVYNNMAYGLKNRGIAKPEIEQIVQKTAKMLNIEEFLDRKPGQLSGGQRQRVAMGRAIVRNPMIFLFDEPLSNLDAKLRVRMRIEIKKLQRELGVTSIYVTHDQVEAMTLGDRLVVINEGQIEQMGSPIEVYQKPASLFVAGFIGSPSMNFLDARLEGNGVTVAGHTLPVSGDLAGGGARSVTLGFRPEHLHRVADGEAGITLTAEVIEHLGADTLIHGTVASDDQTLITLRMAGAEGMRIGETVTLSAAPQDLHFFDAASGRRL